MALLALHKIITGNENDSDKQDWQKRGNFQNVNYPIRELFNLNLLAFATDKHPIEADWVKSEFKLRRFTNNQDVKTTVETHTILISELNAKTDGSYSVHYFLANKSIVDIVAAMTLAAEFLPGYWEYYLKFTRSSETLEFISEPFCYGMIGGTFTIPLPVGTGDFSLTDFNQGDFNM